MLTPVEGVAVNVIPSAGQLMAGAGGGVVSRVALGSRVSFVTKMSSASVPGSSPPLGLPSPAYTVSKAPSVTGKSIEFVMPATTTELPPAWTTSRATSPKDAPRAVPYRSVLPSEEILAT